MFTNISQIEEWLKSNGINNFTLSSDLNVSVQGNVNLNDKLNGEKLPLKFDRIEGYFDISGNNLTTLEGCPNVVVKDFNCSSNKLTSLFDCPSVVGDFDCSNNELKSLSYGPKEVKGFYDCSNNNLTSIKSSPRTIDGDFKCNNNEISNLEGGPKNINGDFNCSNNKIERLFSGPIVVKGDYICHTNNLNDLEGLPDEISGSLLTDIKLNNINSKVNDTGEYNIYDGMKAISHVYKPKTSLTSDEDIINWLERYEIKNYVISDGLVDVNGEVKLQGRLQGLYKLPINFGLVKGDFDISGNELISIEGSPSKVTGSFLANNNEIANLKGSPKEVGGSFVVLNNNITSLKGSPTLVKGDYICSHNPLRTLEGVNQVHGHLFTGVYIPSLRCQKYNYKGITTYKYLGETIFKYLDEEYIVQSEEEKAFEAIKKNLEKAIKKLLNNNSLTKEMITDTLIKNLTKYQLDQLKTKVLWIKEPPTEDSNDVLSEDELGKIMFEKEI